MKKSALLIILSLFLICGCGKVVINVDIEPPFGGFPVSNFLSNLDNVDIDEKTNGAEALSSVSEENQPPLLTEKLKSINVSYKDVGCTQLILVVSSSNTAKIYCYECKDGLWTINESLSFIEGYVGKNGVTSNKKEGDGCSPIGLYKFGDAFGILNDPGTSLNYRKVTNSSYFVDDPTSSQYNTWVESNGSKTWNSAEHMIEHNPNYNYGVIVNYNMDPVVPGDGSAIFLHCGVKSTVGCIAVSESNMQEILLWLKPGSGIVIT